MQPTSYADESTVLKAGLISMNRVRGFISLDKFVSEFDYFDTIRCVVKNYLRLLHYLLIVEACVNI